MAKHLYGNVYACSYCGKKYNLAHADACEKSHHLIYVAITKEDLMNLIQFIYTGERKLLNENLVKRLTIYARAKETADVDVSDMQE